MTTSHSLNDGRTSSTVLLLAALDALSNPQQALHAQRFFKTGPGEYGEGDVFLGIRVPDVRRLGKHFRNTPPALLAELLHHPWHEARLLALVIWVEQYKRASPEGRNSLTALYLEHRAGVNNWDLVDVSAPTLLGESLLGQDPAVLFDLAASAHLWDRRIAMIASLAFIRRGQFEVPVALAERLVHDPHDLMHKAVGWMMREVGKRDIDELRAFLHAHAAHMPRTMLRYAIEKLHETERQHWLSR